MFKKLKLDRNSKEYSHLKSLEKHLLRISTKKKSRLELFIELIQIPPQNRQLNDILLIKEELKELQYFKKLILGDEFLIVCKNIQLVELKDKEVLFKKGDPSKAAYIILKGSIDVVLTRKADEEIPKVYDVSGIVTTMSKG